jgi:hypothetical protein
MGLWSHLSIIHKDSHLSTTLTPQHFYRHDPLLILLWNRLGLTNGWIIVGAAVITGGIIFGAHVLAGHDFTLQNLLIGFDLIWLLISFVLVPLIFAVYLWLPVVITHLFNTLSTKAIETQRFRKSNLLSYDDLLNQLVVWADKRWYPGVALITIVIYWLYTLLVAIPATLSIPSLAGRPTWLIIAILIALSPSVYAGFFSLIRLMIALVFSNRMFHLFDLKINPLHEDGRGGLGIVGHILMISLLIATALGVTAVGISNGYLSVGLNPLSHLEPVIAGVLYFVFTPSAILIWLWLPHQAMLEARAKKLHQLADEYSRVVDQDIPLTQDNIVAVKKQNEQFTELLKRKEQIEKNFPTWPIQIGRLSSLLITAILPLISMLIPVIELFK